MLKFKIYVILELNWYYTKLNTTYLMKTKIGVFHFFALPIALPLTPKGESTRNAKK